jgi:hypothetical protein
MAGLAAFAVPSAKPVAVTRVKGPGSTERRRLAHHPRLAALIITNGDGYAFNGRFLWKSGNGDGPGLLGHSATESAAAFVLRDSADHWLILIICCNLRGAIRPMKVQQTVQ